eukprot:g718.t1
MPPSSQLLLWLALFFCSSRSAAAVASSTTAPSRLLLDLHLKHWRWYRNLRNLLQEFGHPDSRAETRYKRARGDEELPGRRIPVVHRPVLYDQQARVPRPLTGYPHSSTRFAWEEERQVWGEMSRVEIVELPEECYAENSPEHPSFFLFYGAARRESVVGGTFPAHWLTSAFKESWLHGYNYHLKEGYDVYDHLESTAEKLTATKAAEAAAIAAAEAAAKNAETGEAETTTNEPRSSSSTTTSTSTTTSDTQVTTPFKGKIVKNPINFFVTAYDEQDAKYQDFFFRAEDRTNSIGVGKNTDRWAPKALLGMLAVAREEHRKKREEGEDAADEVDDESAVVEQFESLFYRHLFENTLAAEAAAVGAANANATTADVCGVTASAGGGLAVAPCSHQSHATASPTASSQDSTAGAEPVPQALAALAGVDVSPHGSAVIADAYRAISGQDPIILRRMGYIKNIFKGTIFQKFQRNLTAIAGEFSEAVADLLHHSAPEVFADEMGNPGEGAIAADHAAPPEDALLARLAAVQPEHAAPLQALETGGVELFPQRECMGLAYVISRLVEEEYALMGFITAVSSGQIKSSMLRESLDKRFRLQIGRWLTIILDDIVYDTHLFGFFDSKMLLLEEKLEQQGRKAKGRRGTKRFVRQPNYEAERLSHRDRILERSRFTDTLSQILHVTQADLDVETTADVEVPGTAPATAGESSALPSSAEQEGPPPEDAVDLDALLRDQLAQRPRELLTPKFRYAFLPQYIKQNGRAFHRRVQQKSHFAKEEESLLVAFLGHVMQREKLLRILAAWVHDLRYLFDFLEQKIEAEVHLSTNSRAVDKSRITKRHEDWKVESMNQLYSEPTGGFPVPFMAETTLMNLRAGGEARKSQMKEYHLANVFFRHVKEAFDRHFLAVESEEGSGGNGSTSTTSGRGTSTAEPKRQSSAWFPVGGTYIGFLRYGSLQGFHANGRLDIPDADIDLMVTLDEGPEGLSPRDPFSESRDEELEGHEQEQDRLQTRLAELSFMIREEGRYTLQHGTVEQARADAENNGAEGVVEAVPEREKPKLGPAGRTSGLREECRTRLAMEYYAGSHPVPEAGGGDVVTEPAATAPVCSSAQYDLIRESRAIQSRLAELEKARVQKQDAFLDKDLADPRVRAEFGVSYKEYEKYQSFAGEAEGAEDKGKAAADKLKRQLLRPGRRVSNYHAYAANRVFLLSEELVNRFGWAGCRMGDQKLTCYQRAFGILDEVNFYVEVAFLKPLRVVNIPGLETTTSSGRLVYVHCDYLNVAADHDGALVPRSFELLHEIYFPESFFPLRPCHGWGSMVKCPNTFDTLEDYDLPYAKQNAVRYSDYAVLGTFHGNRSHPSPTSVGVAEPGVLEFFRLQETIAARHSRGDSPFPQPGITRDAVFQRLAAGGDEAGGSVDANSLSAISLQIMATATDITAVDIAAQALPQRQAQEGPSTVAASPNSVTSKVARYEEYQAAKVDVVAHQHVVVERSTEITFGVRMAFRFCHEVVRRKANEVGEVPCIVIHLCTEWLGKMGFVKRLADVIGQTGDAISNSEEVPPQSTVSAEEEEVPKPEDLELWLLEQDRFKLPRKTAESFFVSTPEWRHYLQIMNSVCGSIGPIPLKELQPLELVILLSYYPGNADKYAFFASLIRQHKGYETRNYYTNELVGLFADVLTKNLTASVLDRAKIGQPRSLDSLLLDIYFEEVLARFGHEVEDNLEAKAFNWTSVTHETRRRRDGVRHLLLARNESMESSHEPFSSGLCLGIADCFVRKKKREAEKAAAARGPQGHQLQLQEEDMTTQCQEDRHFVFHHPASKKFLQTPMVLQDMVTLLKYNLALTFKGAASHDLGLCDVRYYVRAPA